MRAKVKERLQEAWGARNDAGELVHKVWIQVVLTDKRMPLILQVRSFAAARTFLAGQEFRDLGDRVQSVTIINRAAALPESPKLAQTT